LENIVSNSNKREKLEVQYLKQKDRFRGDT